LQLKSILLAMSGVAFAQNAISQSIDILLANSSAINSLPGYPVASNILSTAEAIGQDGASVRFSGPSGAGNELWVIRNGTIVRLTQSGVTGVTGPNRSSTEANHVFNFLSQNRDFGAAGSVVLTAQAGTPGSSGNPTGIWRNASGQNQEIMRPGVDSALGPNISANWRFNPSTSYLNINHDASDGVIIDTEALSPTDARRSVVSIHRAGTGNTTCMLATDRGIYGPSTGDPNAEFGSGGATGFRPVAFDQRIFVQTTMFNPTREGIWRICNGAPSAIALSGLTGNFGPGTSATGTFSTIRTKPVPISSGAVMFSANYRATNAASLTDGLFVYQGSSNQLVAAENITGALGPNVGNAVFNDLSELNVTMTGTQSYAAFRTTMSAPPNTPRGYWRIRQGGSPEPVVIEGQTTLNNVVINSLGRWTVLGNGDIVAETFLANSSSALVRYSIGEAPKVMLAGGQTITVPTPQGPANATLSNSFFLIGGDSGASSHGTGKDSWIASNGVALFSGTVSLNGNNVQIIGRVLASAQDRIFEDGYE
jgi:hypothetical protein